MSYPKPYTSRTIEKHLKEAGFSRENSAFLDSFFKASANLYGIVSLRQMFALYRDYRKLREAPKLHLRDFASFAEITRRAQCNYHVYLYDEVFDDHNGEEGMIGSVIIHTDLLMSGRDPFAAVRNLLAHVEQSMRFYMDPYFLSYTGEMDESDEAKDLKEFYGNLKSTAAKLYTGEVCEQQNPYIGSCLKDMMVLSAEKEAEYQKRQEDPQKNEKALKQLEAEKRSADALLLHSTRAFQRLGYMNELLEIRVQSLLELYGVSLRNEQQRHLEELLKAYTETMPCDRLRGWSPAGIEEAGRMMQEQ